MVAPIYADLDDFKAWSHDENATAAPVLFARASEVIDEALIGATYPVSYNTQLPTEAAHIQAIADATCAQVAWFKATGDTDGSGSANEEYDSVSIGSVKLGKKTGPKATPRFLPSGAQLAPGALRVLHVAGLTRGEVISRG